MTKLTATTNAANTKFNAHLTAKLSAYQVAKSVCSLYPAFGILADVRAALLRLKAFEGHDFDRANSALVELDDLADDAENCGWLTLTEVSEIHDGLIEAEDALHEGR